MSKKESLDSYSELFEDDRESLEMLTRNVAKFNRLFTELMASGIDFTLKMEVHGDKGSVLHFRVTNDSFDRPMPSKPTT